MTTLDRAVLGELREAVGDDVFDSVVQLYREDTPALLDAFAKAVAAGDAPGARIAAHSLKSTSATLGATELAALAAEAEHASAKGTVVGLEGFDARLRALYAAAETALLAPG